MLKVLVFVIAALFLAWFFWQGFTGQPYSLPTAATMRAFLMFLKLQA